MSDSGNGSKFVPMATTTLQIQVRVPDRGRPETGAVTVSRSRSMRSTRGESDRNQESHNSPATRGSFGSSLLPPKARTARSLSPALKRTPLSSNSSHHHHQHALPTRSPTPPQGSISNVSSKAPPLEPFNQRSFSPSFVSSAPTTPLSGRMQQTPKLEFPINAGNFDIVKPRRASAVLSRSPSPSPSRNPSLKMANLLSQKVIGETKSGRAGTRDSGSTTGGGGGNSSLRLSNLTPPTSRKYGTTSIASYDRSDSRSPDRKGCSSRQGSTSSNSGKFDSSPRHSAADSGYASSRYGSTCESARSSIATEGGRNKSTTPASSVGTGMRCASPTVLGNARFAPSGSTVARTPGSPSAVRKFGTVASSGSRSSSPRGSLDFQHKTYKQGNLVQLSFRSLFLLCNMKSSRKIPYFHSLLTKSDREILFFPLMLKKVDMSQLKKMTVICQIIHKFELK